MQRCNLIPPGYKESEQENFDDWYKDDTPLDIDPLFEDEYRKQQSDLRRKEDEIEKIAQVVTQRAQLQKVENDEKQRLHDLKFQKRRLDVRDRKSVV